MQIRFDCVEDFVKRKIIYYTDPINDEFSGVGPRRKIRIDEKFPYIRKSPLWRAAAFFVYRIVMIPFAYLYCRIRFRLKIVGKEKWKAFRKNGFYLYGNHTQIPGDAFIHNMIAYPKDAYVIVNPDNIALKGTKNLLMMMGAIPTPTVLSGYKPFSETIQKRISDGHCVVIYPEAHIWPYYTGIRPFPATSFRYPALDGAPVFTFTVTYRRSKAGKPRIIAYVDGPFTARGETIRQKQDDLRNQAYDAMCARANHPDNYAFYTYEYRNSQADTGKEKEPV